jgi:nucleoid-associated protein YgaU
VTGQRGPAGRGALTPAVVAAALFAVFAAAVSISFVVSRGGLVLPVAATRSGDAAALASPGASSPAGSSPRTTAAPVVSARPGATPAPEVTPSPAPSDSRPGADPTLAPGDPLLGLPTCPDHPACYVYTVRRGDTFSGVSDRFGLLLWVTTALNPEVRDPGRIVVGQPLYLGHDPMARLERCLDRACRLYIVRPGDSLSAIASRFHLSTGALLAANPGIKPLRVGDEVRLPVGP